ncbi:hypothetical protein D9M73_87930 [compost metagenome]
MFYILMAHEQSAGAAESLDDARQKGQSLCDAEVIPTTFSIYDEDTFIEDITRTDGRDLSQQIADFNRTHIACPRGKGV